MFIRVKYERRDSKVGTSARYWLEGPGI